MILEIMPLSPLFVGPTMFLLGTLLIIVLILVIARLVLGLAWRLVVIGAVVLVVLWILGVVRLGAPPFG